MFYTPMAMLFWVETKPSSPPPPPPNTYVAEDGTMQYVTEDGTQPYVPET